MNKYDYAKEAVYGALWELCEYDDDVYQRACSGMAEEPIMEEFIKLAAKLDCLSQTESRK